MNDVEQERARRMQEAMRAESDLLADARAEIKRLRQEAANYKFALFSAVENVHKPQMADAKADIERLRVALREAVEILEGDGEYPETAKRMRRALKGATAQSPEPVGNSTNELD